MRWLFLFLLVLNAAYLSWNLMHADSERDAIVATPRDVDTIVLLSELDADPVVIALDAEPGAADIGSPVDTSTETGEPDVERTDDAASIGNEAVASTDDNETTAAVQAASAARQPASSAVPAAVETAGSDTTVQAPERFRCFTLGPFRALEDLRAVTRDIKDYVAEASFRSREEREATRFRVYLTPPDGLEGANRLTGELRQKGIRDTFIISRGPLKHSVSLGYFSEKKRAYKHADTIRSKGFEPVVEPVFNTYTLYWLDYRIREGAKIPPELFENRLDRGAGRLSRTCA